MRKDTKCLLIISITESLLLEAIIWCGVNNWKVNPFLAINAVAFAFVGFLTTGIVFISWGVKRS